MSTDSLKLLFKNLTGTKPQIKFLFKQSGSGRQYYRLANNETSLIGCYNEDVAENEAFFHLTDVFGQAGFSVPEIFTIDNKRTSYLQADLGDELLYHKVLARKEKALDTELLNYYKKVLSALVDFQTIDQNLIDSGKYYPVPIFNRDSINWDLNYFKYYFLKLHDISFNEHDLQVDFDTISRYLINDDMRFFMYRDFQSRNVVIRNNEPWFIDYQGGRKGPLTYDVASLLYQAKANLLPEDRKKLLNYYLSALKERDVTDVNQFVDFYYPFALLRTLQVLGAYGFRGLYQRKSHFLASIGYALENLKSLLPQLPILDHTPELKRCLNELVELIPVYQSQTTDQFRLIVQSFSFINGGVPADTSGHGGGYVFDCRMLPNPGRQPEYASLNGMDKPVQDFLQQHEPVQEYINNALDFAQKHIEIYQKKSFNYLTLSFGCTGGQHRSVYCAERAAKMLHEKFPNIRIEVKHLIQKVSYLC